jgi:hypothetical protein
MASTIIPYINPIKFYKKGFTPQAQFNSKHLNDVPFEEQLYLWQQKVIFKQPWQLNDSIRLQFRSELGPVVWKLYTSDGALKDQDNLDQVLQNADNPGEYVYQADIALSIYDPGCYYLEVEFGDDLTIFSETLEFSNLIENSLLLQYKHSSYREEVMFETGVDFMIRIYARMIFKTPASKDVVYEDQELNETMVDSKSYHLWELQLSDERGIPDWLIIILNGILGCDYLLADGRFYTKSEGSKLEESKIDNYAMRGWKTELREQLNRRAEIFDTAGSTNQGHSLILNTDSKGFIEEETGGSEFQILDIQ